mgnify:FL=1
METEKIGFWGTLGYSMTKADAYRIFQRRSVGKAVVCLLLLSLIFGSLSLIRPMVEFSQAIDEFTRWFALEAPEFVLENGELTVEGEQPVFVQEEDMILIIDTTGQYDESSVEQFDEVIFIGRDKLVNKENGRTQIINFQDFADWRITKDNVVSWLPLFKWCNILLYLFGLLFFIAKKYFLAFILGLIGLVFAKTGGGKLGFADSYKLSHYALTLPIIVKVALEMTGLKSGWFLLIYLLALIYLWQGLKAVKREEPPVQIDPPQPLSEPDQQI